MLNLIVFIRILLILGVIGVVVYPIYIMTQPGVFDSNEDATDEEKVLRTQNRGTLVSIFSSILLAGVGALYASNNVSNFSIEVLFGFIFAPVVGYMLDMGVGTDKGMNQWTSGLRTGISYMFSSLYNLAFARFIITFLLDMFISKPISGIFKGFMVYQFEKISVSGTWAVLDNFIKTNLTSIVQSIVAFITFQAYTNQTRFLWAYPDKSLPPEHRIQSATVMLALSISASLYLFSYRKDANSLSINMVLVTLSFLLLTGLQSMNGLGAPTEDDEIEDEVSTTSTTVGMIIFAIFFAIGILAPIREFKSSVNGLKPVATDILSQMKIKDPLTIDVYKSLKNN